MSGRRARVALRAVLLATALAGSGHAAPPAAPAVDLRENLRPSPVRSPADPAAADVTIVGRAAAGAERVRVRITTSGGHAGECRAAVADGRFSCRYPADFPGATLDGPQLLYVDATAAAEFGGAAARELQAEIVLVVAGPPGGPPPDLPLVFTDDLLDAAGRKDAAAAQFPRNRTLVNLLMSGRAAALMGIQRPGFDLVNPADLAWFRDHATLYDFDHRDRDWATPLGQRPARGFWQAMWNRWFNPTNDHPWDGDAANRSPANYRPYTFANDLADLVILHVMAARARPLVPDGREPLVRDAIRNLLALEHRSADNFALPDATGRREQYGPGAFRYGLFETGEWLTEGTGWFANPRFRDYAHGGVFNGRCGWAVGEALAADPSGPLAAELRGALARLLAFCLHDALPHGTARRTPSGLPLWGPPGEHGYLVLGMAAACRVAADLPIALAPDEPPRRLDDIATRALDALVEAADADGGWTGYCNVNAINVLALAEGANVLADRPGAARWRAAAARGADLWLGLAPPPAGRREPTPLFGQRRGDGMTFFLGDERLAHVELYANGHWLHALAAVAAATGDPRYAARAHAILGYYCGDNPLHVRLLDEIGAVNNRVTDTDGDGIEDRLAWDAYPEATAFVQMGLLRLLAR
jgi:hypothetical protein